jgi:hypothetical protein
MPRFLEDTMDEEELLAVTAWVMDLRDRESPGGWSFGRSGPVAEGFLAIVLGLGLLGVIMYLLGERTHDDDEARDPTWPVTRDEEVPAVATPDRARGPRSVSAAADAPTRGQRWREQRERQDRAARLAAACFLVAILAAIGLFVVYVRGGQVQLEGLLLFVAFGAVGLGLGIWVKRIVGPRQIVEDRYSMRSATGRPRRVRACVRGVARGSHHGWPPPVPDPSAGRRGRLPRPGAGRPPAVPRAPRRASRCS